MFPRYPCEKWYLYLKFKEMLFKLLVLILVGGFVYRMFNASQRRIPSDEGAYIEPDEYIDYEEVTDDEENQ